MGRVTTDRDEEKDYLEPLNPLREGVIDSTITSLVKGSPMVKRFLSLVSRKVASCTSF